MEIISPLCQIGKYSGQEHPPGRGRNKLLPFFFKNREEISFHLKKHLHGKNQRASLKNSSPYSNQKCLMFNSSFLKFLTKKSSPPTQYLKSDSHFPNISIIICFIDSPSKMMKNAFYFILKALFVLKIFKFLS